MTDYLQGFAGYLALERNSSDNTIAAYCRDVRQFSHYLSEKEGMEPPQAGAEQLERYPTCRRNWANRTPVQPGVLRH